MAGIKTIMVHLASDRAHALRLAIAMRLAQQHGAKLTGIFVDSSGHMPSAVTGRGASRGYLDAAREGAREAAAALQEELRRAGAASGFASDWIEVEGEPLPILAAHGRLADLVVVGRRESEEGLESELCEQLPGLLPCPLLVVPEEWTRDAVGSNVLVAWKPSRESARALRDARPILAAAASVTLLTIGDDNRNEAAPAQRYLAAHGIAAAARVDHGSDTEGGRVILGVADELGADLVVMGSYGRSRMRELVLGGATRAVVTDMRVPVLFSR
jgi:nucleotide-binding universal stress UspA family protein